MSPYRKAATFVLRLIGLGLLIAPLILFGLDYFASKAQHTTPSKVAMILKIASALAGLVLLIASGSIARRLTEDFDE